MGEQQVFDTKGRAYGRKAGTSDPILTQVGPGTPGGELLRRYWQPIALSSEATTLPKEIRRFGEDLILFRNKKGEPGLLTPRCIHRGTSLFYGKVEDDGIRCCYHGWKFSPQGKVLEQPCEPEGGRSKDKLRQPWYPVVEKYGAIWTYMGPPEKQPLFPILPIFEGLSENEEVVAVYESENSEIYKFPEDYNWFQGYENAADHFHVAILHQRISGLQFADDRFLVDSAVLPDVSWQYSADNASILTISKRYLDSGEVYVRIEEGKIPNVIALPPFFHDGGCHVLDYFIAIDDKSFVEVQFIRQPRNARWSVSDVGGFGPDHSKFWRDMTLEEHQRYPTDYEAQRGMGTVTLHSEEHISASDQGVVMHRLLFKRQCKAVAEGLDPIGVAFKEEDRPIIFYARSWIERADEPVPEFADQ